MAITPSKLRQNIYRLLERVAKTGIPLEVRYKGKLLKIIADKKLGKIERLKKFPKRKMYKGNPEDFVHMDWSKEWKPFI